MRVAPFAEEISKAYDVVVDIWVPTLWIAGTPFRRIDEKLGAETGDFVVTYMLVVAVVGLCRHAVETDSVASGAMATSSGACWL